MLIEITPLMLLLFGTAATFAATAFWRNLDRAEKARAKEKERVDKMESDLALLLSQFSPFWKSVESQIIKDLTHPSPQFKQMDDLLRKLEALTITPEERSRLIELLRERMVTSDPEVSPSERESAKIMITVMGKVVDEALQLRMKSDEAAGTPRE